MRLVILSLGLSFPFFVVEAGDAGKGAELYQRFDCIQCHGAKGEGMVDFKAPRIGGQQAWYIEKALADFGKNGVRGGKHTKKVMKISASERSDLAAYVSNLK